MSALDVAAPARTHRCDMLTRRETVRDFEITRTEVACVHGHSWYEGSAAAPLMERRVPKRGEHEHDVERVPAMTKATEDSFAWRRFRKGDSGTTYTCRCGATTTLPHRLGWEWRWLRPSETNGARGRHSAARCVRCALTWR